MAKPRSQVEVGYALFCSGSDPVRRARLLSNDNIFDMVAKISKTETAPGLIEPNVLYTLDELKRRMKLGDWAIRKARKAGLRVQKIGNARFVFGRDFQKFVEEHGDEER